MSRRHVAMSAFGCPDETFILQRSCGRGRCRSRRPLPCTNSVASLQSISAGRMPAISPARSPSRNSNNMIARSLKAQRPILATRVHKLGRSDRSRGTWAVMKVSMPPRLAVNGQDRPCTRLSWPDIKNRFVAAATIVFAYAGRQPLRCTGQHLSRALAAFV